MKKRDEITNPLSCLNKARDHEMLFVLLARDAAAPATVRFWIAERIRLRLNTEGEAQIQEAFDCAIKLAEKFHCHRCGWDGPLAKAAIEDDEPPTCPICG